MNQTPAAERVHIAFFGRRNAGKSSLVNAISNQNLAIVSDTPGTTTDPVYKSMELLPLGPVMLIDTPGIDDEGELGALRVKKAYQVLNKTDLAVLVVDGCLGLTEEDKQLIRRFCEKGIRYLIAFNKADQTDESYTTVFGKDDKPSMAAEDNELSVSALSGKNIHELKEKIAKLAAQEEPKQPLVGDLLKTGDIAVLVVPIDKAAPKGRLILPQQQTIRDALEAGAIPMVTKDSELQAALRTLAVKPKLVITDSQVFGKVSKEVPEEISLTSFSILFARYKGILRQTVEGLTALQRLAEGDSVLISEGCTHHRQCDDIGTVKIPKWLGEYTNKCFNYAFSSGTEFPDDLTSYKLIIHCGGCMVNEREMKYRLQCAADQGVPMTNYGILIAHIHGVLQRSIALFPDIASLYQS